MAFIRGPQAEIGVVPTKPHAARSTNGTTIGEILNALCMFFAFLLPNEWKGLPSPKLAARREVCSQRHQSARMKRSSFSLTYLEGKVLAIIFIRIDIAKNVFAVYGADETG